MKGFHRLLGFLLVAGLFLMPGFTYAGTLQNMVDVFLTALGSQSPDPGMASALGAAPGATRTAIIFKCNQNLQNIDLELDKNPSEARRKVLAEESDRNQAILSALSGDPEPLKKFTEYRKKRELERKKKRKAEERKEHEDSMNFQLDQFREEIDALKTLKNKIRTDGEADLSVIQINLVTSGYIQDDLKKYETLILSLVDQGEDICDEAVLLQNKLNLLTTAIDDGETLLNTKINLAKERKANCKTAEDGIFIKDNYLAAQQALVIMKRTKETAFETFVEINVKFEEIKRTNDNLKKRFNNNWWLERRHKDKELLEVIPKYVKLFKVHQQDAQKFPAKAQKLKVRIEDSKQYYLQYFPKAWLDFEGLLTEVDYLIDFHSVMSPAAWSDLMQKYQRLQNTSGTSAGNRRRLFKGSLPKISCFSNRSSQKKMDRIDAAFFRAVLAIKANQHLSAGCQSDSSVPPPQPPEEKTDPSRGDGTPPPIIPPVATTSANPPVKSDFGGLMIVGPKQITVGQGVSYLACDKTGKPYTIGTFAWNHSREDLMVLARSGNPATGGAFKPGKVTMFVVYEGMKAYLDIEIKPKEEENLFGSFGGEDDSDSDENLFSTAGGEEGNSENSEQSSSPGDATMQSAGQFKQKCNNLVDLIVWSLNHHDSDSAQTYTNQAVALGCDINTAEVDRVVSQIEDTKKREQQQAQQQQAQQQQINLLNVIVKGLQSIQDGDNPPSRKPSHTSNPLPTADSIWQSHHPIANSSTYNGANPFGGSGNTNQPQQNNQQGSTEIKDTPYCQRITQSTKTNNTPYCHGHTLYCKDNGVPVRFAGGQPCMPASALDRDSDGICDICGKPIGDLYHDSPYSTFHKKNRECRTSPW